MNIFDKNKCGHTNYEDKGWRMNNLDETARILKDAIVIKNECPLYKDVIKLFQDYCDKIKSTKTQSGVCFICETVEKMK